MISPRSLPGNRFSQLRRSGETAMGARIGKTLGRPGGLPTGDLGSHTCTESEDEAGKHPENRLVEVGPK